MEVEIPGNMDTRNRDGQRGQDGNAANVKIGAFSSDVNRSPRRCSKFKRDKWTGSVRDLTCEITTPYAPELRLKPPNNPN